jgi:hypothetical protein
MKTLKKHGLLDSDFLGPMITLAVFLIIGEIV